MDTRTTNLCLVAIIVVVLFGMGTHKGFIGSSLVLPETTAPTGVLGQGALYFSSVDSAAHYVDSSDVDVVLGGSADYGEYYTYENTGAQIIETASTWVGISDNTGGAPAAVAFTAGQLSGVSFDGGKVAAIASVADDGSGNASFTSAMHGLTVGYPISMVGFAGSPTYNTVGLVSEAGLSTFEVTGLAFDADDSGTFALPARLTVTATGVYQVDWSTSIEAGGSGKTYDIKVFVEATEQDQCEHRRKFTNNDWGVVSGGCLISAVAGNTTWMGLRNTTPDVTTLVIRYLNLHLSQVM